MDIALHVGTLFSVLIYFHRDVLELFKGTLNLFKRDFRSSRSLFVLKLAVACLPVFIIGFFCHDHIETYFRSPKVIAFSAIVFGVLLYLADKKGKKEGTIENMSMKNAFFIGLAQVLALFPGVSRSGITMTAARFLGVNRAEAARFSMLLSIPTIAAAGLLGMLNFLSETNVQNIDGALVVSGMLIAFAGGVAAIGFLMRWLKTSSFAIFAIYRVLLGIVLFYVF